MYRSSFVMAMHFVVACTNNNAMLCCVDLFIHVVASIATLFIFCELEQPRGSRNRSVLPS